MNMSKHLCLLVSFLFSISLNAQDILEYKGESNGTQDVLFVPSIRRPIRHHSVYFELAGSGGFGSFNYEWTFKQQEKIRWMLRAGLSGTYIDKNNGVAFIFPVMVHTVYGRKHGLDIGIGQALTVTTRGGVFLRTPLSIGYRLEPNQKRIFYRFSYTPIVSYLIDFQWEHWGGITIGYKLR